MRAVVRGGYARARALLECRHGCIDAGHVDRARISRPVELHFLRQVQLLQIGRTHRALVAAAQAFAAQTICPVAGSTTACSALLSFVADTSFLKFSDRRVVP
jgi:hypothetical protein